MNIKPLLEKLTDKWPAKAICIVVACFFYIFNQYTSLEQRSLSVPLIVSQDGEMICRTHIPSSVTVLVKTNSEKINQVSVDGIVAKIDLSYCTEEGKYEAPVFIDLPASLKEFSPLQVTVVPEKIRVQLEKNIAKTVGVEAKGAGESPYGYEATGFSCEPKYVEIFGPRSIVESIKSLYTQDIVLDEKKATFTQTKEIVNLDRLIKINGEKKVEVTTTIDYVYGQKEIKNVPIELKYLNEEFEVEYSYYSDIVISGAQLILDDYELLPNTLSVNLESITEVGEYEIPVVVTLPRQIHLESLAYETIRVVVKEKSPIETEEILEAAE